MVDNIVKKKKMTWYVRKIKSISIFNFRLLGC